MYEPGWFLFYGERAGTEVRGMAFQVGTGLAPNTALVSWVMGWKEQGFSMGRPTQCFRTDTINYIVEPRGSWKGRERSGNSLQLLTSR